ncbi:thioredoxin fold domain-containing protein [Deinococcus antarcticus]|uniref:Thioredoxin-like fold domain-containing protein n=2 Tax=Deinococcus TaxID=1298 RepID=A0ABP9VI13_9DEIO
MTEHPFVLLTQNDCPNCERLKKMLSGPLRNAYQGSIRVVHREEQAEEFTTLADLHGIQSVPTLIHATGAVLRNTGGLGEVKLFLERF